MGLKSLGRQHSWPENSTVEVGFLGEDSGPHGLPGSRMSGGWRIKSAGIGCHSMAPLVESTLQNHLQPSTGSGCGLHGVPVNTAPA